MYTVESKIDLSKVPSIEKCSIDVDGWLSPLEIHSGVYNMGSVQFLIWKLAEVEYSFRIKLKLVYQHHGDAIEEHFKLTLEHFRKDYLEWMEEGFPEDWQQKYYHLFNDYIIK